MQPVKHSLPRNDPAPSRWSYRYQRLMLTPLFRLLLRAGVPFALAFGAGLAYLSDDQRRMALVLVASDLRQEIETRPEFMVKLLAVDGAGAEIEEQIREIFPHDLPATSFDIDLEAVREMIAGLPGVADASVRLRKGGVLLAEVVERQPAALWRSRAGLVIVDEQGVIIGDLHWRGERPELPVIAGDGADAVVPEAIALHKAAEPLHGRLRGLVRVGERRWDVVLDREQRIMLPEQNPIGALERVIVLSDLQDLLERDLVAVDMRLALRPTIRMSDYAISKWWQTGDSVSGDGTND
ncbi:MAG: cell division protein FtsQ/DivIB [Pseudomonadota bacterium]